MRTIITNLDFSASQINIEHRIFDRVFYIVFLIAILFHACKNLLETLFDIPVYRWYPNRFHSPRNISLNTLFRTQFFFLVKFSIFSKIQNDTKMSIEIYLTSLLIITIIYLIISHNWLKFASDKMKSNDKTRQLYFYHIAAVSFYSYLASSNFNYLQFNKEALT